MNNIIIQRLAESIAVKQTLAADAETMQKIAKAVNFITKALKQNHTVYFCGNGGSAADAQHLAAELSGKFYFDRPAMAAEALHCNTSFLTAVANDYHYSQVFSRLISGLGKQGDILIGLSTSGNSANIVEAFQQCKTMGITPIALTGQGGGKMRDISEICICVPSNDTPRIQEAHITIGHIVCELVEEKMFGKNETETP
jgi:D-sedoheptulose 7-phosphate isomerase